MEYPKEKTKNNIEFLASNINVNNQEALQNSVKDGFSRKSTIKTELKKCIKTWCEDTTSHGFLNFIKAESILVKLIWCLLIIMFSGYCFYSKL